MIIVQHNNENKGGKANDVARGRTSFWGTFSPIPPQKTTSEDHVTFARSQRK